MLWLTNQTLHFVLLRTTLMSYVCMCVCVWRASNHGDWDGHWHGDEAQQQLSAPRIPWCDLGQVIIDASVTGHCIHCCVAQTDNWLKELACVCLCLCLCVSVWAEVSHCAGYSPCEQRLRALRQRKWGSEWGRQAEREKERPLDFEKNMIKHNLKWSIRKPWDEKSRHFMFFFWCIFWLKWAQNKFWLFMYHKTTNL